MSATITSIRHDLKGVKTDRIPLTAIAEKDGPRARPDAIDRSRFAARVDRRGEQIEHLLDWIRSAAWGMIASWPELFELGCKHAQHQYGLWAEAADRPMKLPAQLREDLDGIKKDLEDELNFWHRCSAIYAEEMSEVETLAAKARERIADRISKEHGRCDELVEALRENDPQKWTDGLEWN